MTYVDFLKGEEELHRVVLPSRCPSARMSISPHVHQLADEPALAPSPASPARAGATPRCTCFSTCTKAAAALFVRDYLPRVVTSRSPWFGYLAAIYPSLALPFDMEGLRWFYHNDGVLWPREVEWPMSTCHMKHGTVDANASGPPCSSAVCDRWRRHHHHHHGRAANHSESLRTHGRAANHLESLRIHGLVLFGTRTGLSRGSLLVADTLVERHVSPSTAAAATVATTTTISSCTTGTQQATAMGWPHVDVRWPTPTPGGARTEATFEARTAHGSRRFWPSGARAEVIRMDNDDERLGSRYTEGANGYGLWFYAAPGSGIFMDLGKTLVIAHHVSRLALNATWHASSDPAINRTASAAYLRTLRGRKKGREAWPLHAAGLGFDTVQKIDTSPPVFASEIIEVRAPCLHGPAVRTCPGSRSALSTGAGQDAAAHGRCVCDDMEPILTCRGVATSSQRRHRKSSPDSEEADERTTPAWPYWKERANYFNSYERFPWSYRVPRDPPEPRETQAVKLTATQGLGGARSRRLS